MIQLILLRAGYYLFEVISLLIIANVLMSWIRPNPDNAIVKVIYGLTEPILIPLRRIAIIGPLDLSAFAALLLLQLIVYPLYSFIIRTIF